MAEKVLKADSKRSAQLETDRLADSSNILADLPRPRWPALTILPISLLLGFFFAPWNAEDFLIEWPLYSIVLFAIPAWFGAYFSFAYLRLIGGNSYLYRTVILAMINVAIIGLVLFLGSVLGIFLDIHEAEWLIFANATIVMLLNLTHVMTATRRWVLALPATLAQPLMGMLPVFYLYYSDHDWAAEEFRPIVLAVIFIGTFVGVGWMALYVGTRPMSDNYGVDGVDIFRAFLEHWVSGGQAGREDLEAFFNVFAEPMYAHANVVRFRERGGGAPIATVVVPSLHPGPWGELGGSDMPRKFERALMGEHGEVFTFHGASDHDLNPVDTGEVNKLTAVVKEALDSMEGYSDQASPFVRLTTDFDACAQAFNGSVMAVHTSAPDPTDDLDGPMGYAIEMELTGAGASPALMIDAHNCLEPGAGGVAFGTPKARALQRMLGEATREALAGREPGLRVGVGVVANEGEFMSMGPLGFQTLVVEAGGRRMAWVLADGNNAEQGLRERARERLLGKVDEAELLTTDNHIVNVTVGGFNPVGMGDPEDRLLDRIEEGVDLAIADLQDAEAAGTRVEVGDVRVWGKSNTIRLSTTINAAVATSKGALIAALVIALVICGGAMMFV